MSASSAPPGETTNDELPMKGAIATWTQRARGIGLLIGFTVATGASYQAGVPLVDAVLRGVVGAFAMSLIAWWCTLIVIQGLLRTALARRNEERARIAEELREAQAQAAAAAADAQATSNDPTTKFPGVTL